jgi:Spy/CpxP family protein refolding chaperone
MVKKGVTIALIGIFVSAVLVFNGCRSHSAHDKAEFMVDYIAETLDLNDSQSAQLYEIKEEFMAKAKDMHAKKAAMHAEFKDELLKDEIDQDRMKALMAQKREQMAEMMNLAVVRLAEFHATLSAEQREKLVAKLEWFHSKHSRHWE